MALTKVEADWIMRLTAGDVMVNYDLPKGETKYAAPEGVDLLAERLRMLRAKEEVKERALKDTLLQDAQDEIDKKKEILRATTQMSVKRDGGKGKDVQQQVRSKTGDQSDDDTFDTGDMSGVTDMKFAGDKDFKSGKDSAEGVKMLSHAVAEVQALGKRLEAVKVKRSRIDIVAQDIVQLDEPLFTKQEIADEIYTPLVRDKVLGETLVPDAYSQTQDMLDGSDKHYIKECREKGKKPDTGGLALFKGAVTVGATVATTVFGAMGAQKPGTTDISQGHDWSKEQVAERSEMINGVAAVLTAGGDFVDQANETIKNRSFDEGKFDAAIQSIGAGVGKVVGGALGDDNIGGLVTLGIQAGSTGLALGVSITKWLLDPVGDPPIDSIIKAVGGTIGGAFTGLSDTTSDGVSIKWANDSSIVTAAFNSAAEAQKSKILVAIKNGQWREVTKILATCGAEAGKATAACIQNNPAFGATPDIKDGETYAETRLDKTGIVLQETAVTNQATTEKGIEDLKGGFAKAIGKGKDGKPFIQFKDEKAREAMQSKLAEVKKAQEELDAADKKEIEAELKQIEEDLAKEEKEYQASLKCLGSKNPDDAEFKSIAKLIEKLEADKALIDGLVGMFGGGIGAASGVTTAVAGIATQVAPGLKAAGQFVKFLANCKAAHDRRIAWVKWKEGRKDALSAVSPYAKAIDNFAKNQGDQFAQYTIQATANAIQALLAAGEVSPFAPAFKAAGGAVGAAAALEDTLYKFYKIQALRKAWHQTKVAIDPKNKDNRKMRLLARKTNPTLAKYTIAYGALVQEDPIAITAMSRCGLDRETLTRAGDKVKDVKGYLEKLYPDDGSVLVTLDIEGSGGAKVPEPALDTKAWELSYQLWVSKGKLDGKKCKNPPGIIGNLNLVETLQAELKKLGDAPDAKLQTQLVAALKKLGQACRVFAPLDVEGKPLKAISDVVAVYAELAENEAGLVEAAIDDTEDSDSEE